MTDYQVPTHDERRASRERYIEVQMYGLDCKAQWVRQDAEAMRNYASSLAATRSTDDAMRRKVRASLADAVTALTEALLAVRLSETEYNNATTPRHLQAAE